MEDTESCGSAYDASGAGASASGAPRDSKAGGARGSACSGARRASGGRNKGGVINVAGASVNRALGHQEQRKGDDLMVHLDSCGIAYGASNGVGACASVALGSSKAIGANGCTG